MSKAFPGVYAAVLTPRDGDGKLDVLNLRTLLRALLRHDLDGLALNGATGEFCLTTPEELRIMLSTTQEVCAGRLKILCGIGAPGLHPAKQLATIAGEYNVDALLLPMPYFFPYEQQDLDVFSRAVAGETSLPIVLYNLPQFSTGLTKETVRTLIQNVPNIVGIKDSSGSLEILRDLTLRHPQAIRMMGNDVALAAALEEDLCDGVVSGVACALPELIQAIFQAGKDSSELLFQHVAVLNEFILHLDQLPTPWGIKFAAEARGFLSADFAQPLTAERREAGARLQTWVTRWMAKKMTSTVVGTSVT